MARVKRGTTTHAKHKKILDMAKGYRGRSKSCYRVAIEKVKKGMEHAYRDRKDLKGNMRSLWIVRINAACRNLGVKYNQLMHALSLKKLEINRKMLSEMAIRQPEAFKQLVKNVCDK